MQLTASYLTLSGARYDGEENKLRPKYSALERAKAANACGIESIGVRWDEPIDSRVLRYVKVPEAEWVDLSLAHQSALPGRLRMLHEDFGLTRLNVGHSGPAQACMWRQSKRLMHITQMCDQMGITVAVEPVVFGGGFQTMPMVGDLLGYDSYPGNTGLLYDMFQVDYAAQMPRRDRQWSSLDELNVVEIQVCGTRERYDMAHPWMESQDRLPVADSFETVKTSLEYLRWKFPQAALSYELPNEAWRQLPLIQICEHAAQDMALL